MVTAAACISVIWFSLTMGEHLFERLARERNITVEEMRAIISARMEKGWNDPNRKKRAQWRTM